MSVLIRTAQYNDPRFSGPQLKAIELAAASDPGALLLGLDHAMRPVVQAKLGIPRSPRTYAIQRNGDPTEVKSSTDSDAWLLEEWGE